MTPSSSINACSEAPSISAPGSTSLAPTAGTLNASPQALAWNMGTTISAVSRAETPMTSACSVMKVCSTLDRCE